MTKDNKPTEPTKEELELMTMQLNIAMLASEVQSLQIRMQKLDEVYYHVFPDRLPQDLKFTNQLIELNRPSKPGDDKKQS